MRLIFTFACCLLSMLFFAGTTYGSADDYDLLTGEPKCVNCHTSDRKYSIDYTREESCEECHGPDLSARYVSIDARYKKADGEIQAAGSLPHQVASRNKPAPASSKQGKQGITGNMVLVPAGEFTMGSNDWWPKSGPEHKRNLPAFYIDRYEVRNSDYKVFVDETGYRAPDHWQGGSYPKGREKHPVVFVNWFDADNYCRWKGKRLPMEAEWEKAARGTDKRTFPWGNKFGREKANGNEDTMPVGSFESGKSPYGIYDMAGNVWEWTADWFQPFPGNTHPDENYGEKYRVVKGGSWYDCTYYKCGISAPTYNRIFFNPQTRNNNFGFRCAKDK